MIWILVRSEIGWEFENSSFEPFLCTEITFAVLNIEGKTQDEKEILNMTFSISVLSAGLTNKETLDLFLRKSEKSLCENEMLSLVLLLIEEK